MIDKLERKGTRYTNYNLGSGLYTEDLVKKINELVEAYNKLEEKINSSKSVSSKEFLNKPDWRFMPYN